MLPDVNDVEPPWVLRRVWSNQEGRIGIMPAPKKYDTETPFLLGRGSRFRWVAASESKRVHCVGRLLHGELAAVLGGQLVDEALTREGGEL